MTQDHPGAVDPDRVVVHIGPHKTGSTAVQMSLFDAKSRLRRAGTLYPVDERHPRFAILAAIGRPGLKGDPAPSQDEWDEICAVVVRNPDRRIVLSSEIFTDASDDTIHQVVSRLGGSRVHVVVSLRALGQILPSQWQQYLQSSMQCRYIDWLSDVLRAPDSPAATRFWRRHAHDELIARWLTALAPGALTVVVSDPSKPRALLESFEALLALPTGTLHVPPQANRSLTMGEAELVRLVNVEAARNGWSDAEYAERVRRTLCWRLRGRVVSAEDGPIVTPAWALELAQVRQTQIIDAITARGITIHGDVDQLTSASSCRVDDCTTDPLSAAIELIAGMALRDSSSAGIGSTSRRTLARGLGSRALRVARIRA